MPGEDIKISFGPDGGSLNALRKAVSKALKDVPLTISTKSVNNLRKSISDGLSKNPIKVKLDINQNSIRSLRTAITNSIGSVKINVVADNTAIQRQKNRIQNFLGRFRLDFSNKGDIKAFENRIKKIGAIKLNLDQSDLAAFVAKAEQAFANRPIRAKVVFTTGTLANATSPGVTNFTKQLNSNAKAINQQNAAIQKGVKNVRTLGSAHKATSSEVDNFAARVGFSTTRLAAYLIPATAIFQLQRAFRGASDAILDINTDISKLTQVLGGRAREASELAEEILQTAVKFGQSGRELLKVGVILSQSGDIFQGNTGEILENLAQTQLGATFGDINSTTEGLIAALNQFNLTGDDTARVLDTINELAKQTAFEAENFFTAVQRGGASFAVAGGTVEEFGAVTASLRELTRQSPSTIGTGINTIALRFLRRDTVEFLDELTGGKIRDAEGNFVGITQAILETGRAFRTLDQVQQVAVIERVSGLRQGRNLAPLLKDIAQSEDGASTLERTLGITGNSFGSLAKDAETGLARMSVQLQRVGASFDLVLKQFAEDDGIQRLVSEISQLGAAFAGLLEFIKPIIPTLARFAAIKLGTGLVGGGALSFLRGSQILRPGPFNPGSVGAITADPVRTRHIAAIQNNTQAIGRLTGAMTGTAGRRLSPIDQLAARQNPRLFRNRESSRRIDQHLNRLAVEGRSIQNRVERRRSAIVNANLNPRLDPQSFNFHSDRLNRSIQSLDHEISRSSGRAGTFARAAGGIRPSTNFERSTIGLIRDREPQRFQEILRRESLLGQARLEGQNLRVLNQTRKDLATRLQKLNAAYIVAQRQTNNINRSQAKLNASIVKLSSLQNRAANAIGAQRTLTSFGGRFSSFAGRVGRGAQRIGSRAAVGALGAAGDITGFATSLAFDRFATSISDDIRPLVNDNGKLVQDISKTLSKNERIQQQQSGAQAGSFGAIFGAQAGAAIGTAIAPVIGTAIGGIVGAGVGGFGAFAGAEFFADTNQSVKELLSLANSVKDFSDRSKVLVEIFDRINQNTDEALLELSPFERFNTLFNLRRSSANARDFADQSQGLTGAIRRGVSENPLAAFNLLLPFIKEATSSFRTGEDLTTSEGRTRLRVATQERFAKRLTDSGISPEEAQRQASIFSTVIFGTFIDAIDSTTRKVKGISDEFRIALDFNKGSLNSFINTFNKFTDEINKSNTRFADQIRINQQVFDASIGNFSQIEIPQNLGERLINELLSASENLTTRSPELGIESGRLVNQSLGNILSSGDKDIATDIIALRRLVVGIADAAERGSSTLTLAADDSATILADTIDRDLIQPFLSQSNIRNTFKTQEVADAARQAAQRLVGAAASPEQFRQSPEGVVSNILSGFGNLEFITNRVNAELDTYRLRIQETNNQNERLNFILDKRVEIEGEITNTRLSQINRSRSTGANSFEVLNNLRNLIGNTNRGGINVSDITRRISLQSGGSSENVQSIIDLNDSALDASNAHKELDRNARITANTVSILNAQFNELTSVINENINTNKSIGTSTEKDLRSAEQKLLIFFSQVGGLFGQGGSLSGVNNPQDLFRQLGPDQIKRLATQFSSISPSVIAAGQAAEQKFGGRQFAGAERGVTLSNVLDIVTFLKGAGRVDPLTGGLPDLQQLQTLANEQLNVFGQLGSIEDQQLAVLISINEAVRKSNNLPLPSLNDLSQTLRQTVPQSNLPPERVDPPNRQEERAEDNRRVKALEAETRNVLQLVRFLGDRFEGQSKGITDLTKVLGQLLADADRGGRKGTGSQNIKFDTNIDVTGFDAVARDVAAKEILTGVLTRFRELLSAGTPSEQELARKLGQIIQSLRSNNK